MTTTELTPVPDAALPLARFRAHLRLGTGFSDDSLQDGLLAGFLRAAMAAIEARTGRALLIRDFRAEAPRFSAPTRHLLPVAPAVALNAVQIVAPNGNDRALDLAGIRLVAEALVPLSGSFPDPGIGGLVRIDFTAGYGADFDAVPADLAQAVMLLASHYYENRDTTALGPGCMPFGVSALIDRYCPLRLTLGGVS